MNASKYNLNRMNALGQRVRLFAAKGPYYHYTYGRWRFRRWLERQGIMSTALKNDQAFFDQFDLTRPELSWIWARVVEGDYKRARATVLVYFQKRITPRFSFEQDQVEHTLSLIDSHQKEATTRMAERLCQNIFDFRQMKPIKFDDDIDWSYCPQGNIDWTWDLNRHAYFETLGRAYWYTGDERYAQKFRTLLLDWLAKNPVSANRPNWASVFEVAFRLNVWMGTFYYFRFSDAFDQTTCLELLKGLLIHGRYLDAHLELHVKNNHLLLEAKALAMLGILFPEFKCAEGWRQRGLEILYEQIRAQICSDGVHRERATLYHRIIAGELLELLVLSENNNLPIPPDIVEAFGRMVEFEVWITKPDGRVPLLGDSTLEDTYLRFSAADGGPIFLRRPDLSPVTSPVGETSIWLLGHQRVNQYLSKPGSVCCLNSRPFLEGGYFVMRQQGPQNSYMVFDCGPFGYEPVPSHGHADALSFELYMYNQTMVVDPGVYSTRLGHNWRNFFRGSRAHNTVVVDHQDQSILVDIWRVYHPAQTTLHQWISSDEFDFVDGSHNGYERFTEPVNHRRQIFFVKPEYWVVIDSLTGQGKHCFDLYFHLLPGVETRLDPNTGSLRTGDEVEPGLNIIPLITEDLQADLITGATTPIQGWISFFSGEMQPAPTLRYRRETVAPLQFCTILYPHPAGKNETVAVYSLDVTTGDTPINEQEVTGLLVETDAYLDYLIIDRKKKGELKEFAGYRTDANLAYLRHRKDNNDLVKVVMRGGDQLLFRDQPLQESYRNFVQDCERNRKA